MNKAATAVDERDQAQAVEQAITRLEAARYLGCRCLHVTASGFYARCHRPESSRARDDRRLKVLVRASFDGR